MDYHLLAREILDLVGGPDNIESFTNCMTRLRLNLIRPQTADAEAINGLAGSLESSRVSSCKSSSGLVTRKDYGQHSVRSWGRRILLLPPTQTRRLKSRRLAPQSEVWTLQWSRQSRVQSWKVIQI
ncbi:PTS system [Cutibacterium acnes JCM 18918]|nr:PTS system [Cutibacterium acnes JCM 18918]